MIQNQEIIRKKLEDMNLLDDFLFTTMVNDADVGEEFSKILIKTICGHAINHLKVSAQKVYYGSDTHLHGVRLDVYLKEFSDEDTENASNEDLKTLQNMVNTVKHKEEVASNYMWAFERDRELIEEGRSVEKIDEDIPDKLNVG